MTMQSCQEIPSHVQIKKGQRKGKRIPTKSVSQHPPKSP